MQPVYGVSRNYRRVYFRLRVYLYSFRASIFLHRAAMAAGGKKGMIVRCFPGRLAAGRAAKISETTSSPVRRGAERIREFIAGCYTQIS